MSKDLQTLNSKNKLALWAGGSRSVTTADHNEMYKGMHFTRMPIFDIVLRTVSSVSWRVYLRHHQLLC